MNDEQSTHEYVQPKERGQSVSIGKRRTEPNRGRKPVSILRQRRRRSSRLIGGNLNTMWSIWGSPYMPSIQEGDILLIEDSLKSIATVERLLHSCM